VVEADDGCGVSAFAGVEEKDGGLSAVVGEEEIAGGGGAAPVPADGPAAEDGFWG
jgi:hypothetical protein